MIRIKGMIKGGRGDGARSRFTENKLGLSQFTGNEMGISRFTKKKQFFDTNLCNLCNTVGPNHPSNGSYKPVFGNNFVSFMDLFTKLGK